mmetsp:Transcript_27293/g.59604  ORF Transcript_27293/g.59604 Transcript_27293/m.59604 type:complete len:216 (-) Transcript_27293:1374-2021(-)
MYPLIMCTMTCTPRPSMMLSFVVATTLRGWGADSGGWYVMCPSTRRPQASRRGTPVATKPSSLLWIALKLSIPCLSTLAHSSISSPRKEAAVSRVGGGQGGSAVAIRNSFFTTPRSNKYSSTACDRTDMFHNRPVASCTTLACCSFSKLRMRRSMSSDLTFCGFSSSFSWNCGMVMCHQVSSSGLGVMPSSMGVPTRSRSAMCQRRGLTTSESTR